MRRKDSVKVGKTSVHRHPIWLSARPVVYLMKVWVRPQDCRRMKHELGGAARAEEKGTTCWRR
jgi:hypothetical protein